MDIYFSSGVVFFIVQNLISSLFCLLTKYGWIGKLMHVLVRNECISFKFHPGKESWPIDMGLFHPVKTRSCFFQGTSSHMNTFKFNERVRSCQSRLARYNGPTHLHISNPYTTSRSKNCKY